MLFLRQKPALKVHQLALQNSRLHIISNRWQVLWACESFQVQLQTKYFLCEKTKNQEAGLWTGNIQYTERGDSVKNLDLYIPPTDSTTAKEEELRFSHWCSTQQTARCHTTVQRKSILICFLN